MSRSSHGRRKRRFHRRTAPGAPPGQIVVDPTAPLPVVRVIAFDAQRCSEQIVEDLTQLESILREHAVTWVHVEGLGDANVIRTLGERFGLHPLELEDVVNVHQRPKLEPYGEHLFIVARMVRIAEQLNAPAGNDGPHDNDGPWKNNGQRHSEPVTTEQVSLFLGHGFVLTFIEDPGDVFEPVRQRLRQASGRIRSLPASYLAYSLLDAVVDAHFPVLERLGDRLEGLEDEIVATPTRQAIDGIHEVKRSLRLLRREMWPTRELLSQLARDTHPLIDAEVRLYLRDCYDHTVQILDLLELFRELGADLTDLYLSSVSNRMNEIIKVLTIMSTLFMPLSFVVGVYGMNFDTSLPGNMPELEIPYGYLYVWLVLLATSAGMLWFFHRRGWIGPPRQVSSNGVL